MSLFGKDGPHLQTLHPRAALPGGEVQLLGHDLGPRQWQQPAVAVGDTPARVALCRPDRLVVRVATGSVSGDVRVSYGEHMSNSLPLRVAIPMAEDMHPVSNPVADSKGNVFVAFSGERGQQVPTSVFRIDPEFHVHSHVTGILNATGVALDAEENLYVSSRQEGTVYRITPDGAKSLYADGLGIATGLAFDKVGNLYCGDRSGTIFKIAPDRQIFVFATMDPSVAAFHLCMAPNGTLFVAAPTTTSYDSVYAIDPEGNIRTYYTGLGRPQGMAIAANRDLLVAASLHGNRGIVRITPKGDATLAIAGPGLVGLACLPEENIVLATNDALYHLRG
jgi:sugar lactone lactonase YvrE